MMAIKIKWASIGQLHSTTTNINLNLQRTYQITINMAIDKTSWKSFMKVPRTSLYKLRKSKRELRIKGILGTRSN